MRNETSPFLCIAGGIEVRGSTMSKSLETAHLSQGGSRIEKKDLGSIFFFLDFGWTN